MTQTQTTQPKGRKPSKTYVTEDGHRIDAVRVNPTHKPFVGRRYDVLLDGERVRTIRQVGRDYWRFTDMPDAHGDLIYSGLDERMLVSAAWTALEAKRSEPTVTAQPYEARQCPECKVWVYTADGPFAENDRTKTMADANHWMEHHAKPEDSTVTSGAIVVGFPFFLYNEEPVEAVKEVAS